MSLTTKQVNELMEVHAIKFGKWLQGCGYQMTEEDNIWISSYGEDKTTEELYQLYIKLPQ